MTSRPVHEEVDDRVIEAVRQIMLQLYHVSPAVVPHGRVIKIQRETIFYLYEGGEAAKWDPRRPHSKAARALGGTSLKHAALQKLITYEHAIPLAVLKDDLRASAPSLDSLRDLLRSRFRGVVITREENQRLRLCGLNARMPADAEPTDLLARYRQAAIEFEAEDLASLLSGGVWPSR